MVEYIKAKWSEVTGAYDQNVKQVRRQKRSGKAKTEMVGTCRE
jgi:hypothetical protein